jgi:hypothetical protein
MASKTARELWQDYRFLTQEMAKFLTKQDMDLFYELMKQRERLQGMIDEAADEGFKNSLEGRALLIEIQQDSQLIAKRLQLQLNNGKRQQQVAAAYGDPTALPVSRMSWSR